MNERERIQKLEATEVIKKDYTVYGSSVITDKFPNYIDGLKAIQRRIIWMTRTLDGAQKLKTVIATTGSIHPTDSSIYDAIIRMSQQFKVGIPLVTVIGKNGEYYAPSEAAAERYLSAYLSKFSHDVFFKNIEIQTIPMMPTYDYSAKEPKYLIPRLPTALMLGNITPGFGFKSNIPMINFNDICDMVIKYADYRQKGNMKPPSPKEYAKFLLPSFPIRNNVINRDEILANYQAGNFDVYIKLEGACELSGNSIIFRTIPYMNDFGKCTSDFTRLVDSKDKKAKDYKWLSDCISATHNYSSDITEYQVVIKQNKNPFEVLDKIRSLIGFSGTFAPVYNFSKDGKVDCLDPIRLFTMWYEERYHSVVNSLKYKQADLIALERKIQAFLIVCDYTDKVTKLLREATSKQHGIELLFNEFRSRHLSWKQATIIADQPLYSIGKFRRKELETQLEQVKLDQQQNLSMFAKIHEIIRNDAEELKREYGSKSPKLTKYDTEYKGYVKYGDFGIIHFFDYNEMYTLLNAKGWGSTKKYIHIYDSKYPNKYVIKNGRQEPMIPTHEVCCSDVICYPNERQDLTLVIHEKEGKACVLEKPIDGKQPGLTICPISKNFYAIHRNGKITEELYTNFALRKTISSGSKTDVIYALPSKCSDMVAFHMNSAEPNVLRIDRILTTDHLGELRLVPSGTRHLLGFFSIDKKEVFLNIPDEYRKNVVIDHLVIYDIAKLFRDGKDHHILDVNKSSALSKKLKRHTEVRSLFILDFRETD